MIATTLLSSVTIIGAVTPSPTVNADAGEPTSLVMGLGWGMFVILLLIVIGFVTTIFSIMFTRYPWVVGGTNILIVTVITVFLSQCPTYAEREAVDRRSIKTDTTANFRIALLVISVFMTSLTIYFVFYYSYVVNPIHFVSRPKRGMQLHKKYKEAVRNAIT